MARRTSTYVCQECGAITPRWVGKCESCGAWNSVIEEPDGGAAAVSAGPIRSARTGRKIELVPLARRSDDAPRVPTGSGELDRVTGGGLVPGSAILVGGDPGIGKSTLLLQTAARLARTGRRVVYVSGEEAVAQVRLRGERLQVSDSDDQLLAETNVEDILATLAAGPPPALVVVDSIQTLWTGLAESPPGTVTQVRSSSQAMIRYAKQSGAAVVLVGHVTKDGQIAGPRVVEHMVDAVMTFEGDPAHAFRILRAAKNRFGPTDEIGVFEMTGTGLSEVANPSEIFLGDGDRSSPGSAVFAGMEGTRPLLVEVQALVAPSPLGTPRRAVVGWDSNRLAMVIAVLEARCGVRLGQSDVYLAIAGGLRIAEPAADLAVAAALVSSLTGVALPGDCVYFGEISLSGRVRPVAHGAGRLKEAEKLGFARAVVPEAAAEGGRGSAPPAGLSITGIGSLIDLVAGIAGGRSLTGPSSGAARAGGADKGGRPRSGGSRPPPELDD